MTARVIRRRDWKTASIELVSIPNSRGPPASTMATRTSRS